MKTAPADVIVFSSTRVPNASRLDETNAPGSLTSSAFMTALSVNRQPNDVALIANMEASLFRKTSVTVQMRCSNPLCMNILMIRMMHTAEFVTDLGLPFLM